MKWLVLGLLALSGTALGGGDDGWDLVNNDDGVTVWEKEVPNSSIFAFRGRKIMHIPISKIADVIVNDDLEQKKRWVDRLVDVKLITYDRHLTTTYHVYGMPFPVSDRDLVWEFKKIIDAPAKTVTVTADSVDLPQYPPEASVGVRGVAHGKYELRMIDPNTTEVTVQAFADPKGWVPKFAVNIMNRMWPRNTLQGLEREAADPATKSDPETLAQIERANGGGVLSH